MKTEPDALYTVENEFGSTKHEKGTRRPWYKMSSVAQNMKTGPGTLSTVENESGGVKNENGTRRHPFRRKRVR
jgi:hypothetical protein